MRGRIGAVEEDGVVIGATGALPFFCSTLYRRNRGAWAGNEYGLPQPGGVAL